MPGTGKHGYTGPSLYGGNYNISNGIIQSGSGASSSAVASRNGPFGRTSDSVISGSISPRAINLASDLAGISGTSDSDYGDYIRELMDVQANNTAQSQSFAREQMEFQRQSDANAMAWSAAEAQKNRDWQERLSNTAHQREVQDLIEAGLNPILSANQGAYTGSGATGQAFSSSGAMGNVDTSINGALASLFATVMNTASQAAIAGLYTDAEKYTADVNFAAQRSHDIASIFNNNNNIDANKAINKLNNDASLERQQIASAAQLGAAATSASAIRDSAAMNAEASMYHSDKALEGQRDYNQKYYQASTYNTRTGASNTRYSVDKNAENVRYQVDNGSIYSVGAAKTIGSDMAEFGRGLINMLW